MIGLGHPRSGDLLRDLGFSLSVSLHAFSMFLSAAGETRLTFGLDLVEEFWSVLLGQPQWRNTPPYYLQVQLIFFWSANLLIWVGLASLAFSRFQWATVLGGVSLLSCIGFWLFDSPGSRFNDFEMMSYTYRFASALVLTTVSSFRVIWPPRAAKIKSHGISAKYLNSSATELSEPPPPPTR
jgi:hypothetical protein